MAITFVGRTQANVAGASQSIAISTPAGIAAGDLMLVLVLNTVANLPAAPSGWTQIGGYVNLAGGGETIALFWKLYAAADGTSYTFGSSNLTAPHAVMRAYRGATKPDANNSINTLSSTSCQIPALSATVAGGEWYVGFWTNGNTAQVITGPGDLVNGTADQTGWATFDGDKVLGASGSVPGAETATVTPSTVNWTAIAATLIPSDPWQPPYRLPSAALTGNQQWWAAPAHIHQHNVVFHGPNPPSYDQHLAPIPARQQGMQLWTAPVAQAQHTIAPFHAANPPSFDHHLAPIPAVQTGMQQWVAPVAYMRTTTGDVNPPPALTTEERPSQLPIAAIQQSWWAPVPALQATVAPFSPANPPSYDLHLFPPSGWQQGMAGWWAPVPQLHPTTTPFHGATENDARPAQLPLAAITGNQPWQAPIVQMRHTIAPFNAANPAEFTTYKLPSAAIQLPWWAPIITARASPTNISGPPPVVSGDPIVVWRHRAGMQ